MWVSGGEELCVWNKDFQLQCHRQNHSDTGEERQKETVAKLSSPLTLQFAHAAD